jgi:hypothetical protein
MSHGCGASTIAAPAQFRPTAGVYALVDPRSGRTMYCGQSLDIDYRYRQHLDTDTYTSNVNKRRWIAGLKAVGLSPRLVILAECPWPQSDTIESEYIRMYKASGQCELNLAVGGKRSRAISSTKNTHQDDWFELGRRLNAARILLTEAVEISGQLAGPKATGEAIEMRQAIDKFKARMEARLTKAYPEWADFACVFYGTEDV